MSNDTVNNSSPNRLQVEETTDKGLSSSSESIEKERKKYINLYFCKLSTGIIFTYIFIVCSITINIVNRIIFWKYKFKFNITLIFLQ